MPCVFENSRQNKLLNWIEIWWKLIRNQYCQINIQNTKFVKIMTRHISVIDNDVIRLCLNQIDIKRCGCCAQILSQSNWHQVGLALMQTRPVKTSFKDCLCCLFGFFILESVVCAGAQCLTWCSMFKLVGAHTMLNCQWLIAQMAARWLHNLRFWLIAEAWVPIPAGSHENQN